MYVDLSHPAPLHTRKGSTPAPGFSAGRGCYASGVQRGGAGSRIAMMTPAMTAPAHSNPAPAHSRLASMVRPRDRGVDAIAVQIHLQTLYRAVKRGIPDDNGAPCSGVYMTGGSTMRRVIPFDAGEGERVANTRRAGMSRRGAPCVPRIGDAP